jgi:hypothetical protein
MLGFSPMPLSLCLSAISFVVMPGGDCLDLSAWSRPALVQRERVPALAPAPVVADPGVAVLPSLEESLEISVKGLQRQPRLSPSLPVSYSATMTIKNVDPLGRDIRSLRIKARLGELAGGVVSFDDGAGLEPGKSKQFSLGWFDLQNSGVVSGLVTWEIESIDFYQKNKRQF